MLYLLAFLLSSSWQFYSVCLSQPTPTLTQHNLEPGALELMITIPVQQPHTVYYDYIALSVDHPSIQLTPWKTASATSVMYDKHFKKNKKFFAHDAQITCKAVWTTSQLPRFVHLHLTYLTNHHPATLHVRFPLIIDRQDGQPALTNPQQLPKRASNEAKIRILQNKEPLRPPSDDDCAQHCLAISIALIALSAYLLSKTHHDTTNFMLLTGLFSLLLGLLFLLHVSALCA